MQRSAPHDRTAVGIIVGVGIAWLVAFVLASQAWV